MSLLGVFHERLKKFKKEKKPDNTFSARAFIK
jgi:hypothetical protein